MFAVSLACLLVERGASNLKDNIRTHKDRFVCRTHYFSVCAVPWRKPKQKSRVPEADWSSGAERAGSPGLGRVVCKCLDRLALGGPGASKGWLPDLEAKERGCQPGLEEPTIYGWERRTRLQWRLQMRNQSQENQESIPETKGYFQEGVITALDADRVMMGRHPRRAVGMLCWGPGITQVSQEEETQDLDLRARVAALELGQPVSSAPTCLTPQSSPVRSADPGHTAL